MAQPGPSNPPPSSPTENPIVAAGRKVKSALISRQRPSVRILRDSSSATEYDAETVDLLDVVGAYYQAKLQRVDRLTSLQIQK